MLALNAIEAINLDGGALPLYDQQSRGNIMQVRNWSSDGSPRAVANGWCIVSTN